MGSKQDATEFSADLPFETIMKSVQGDKAAIETVMKAYEPYIIDQATVDKGTPTERVDEDLAQSLRLALLEAIPKFPLDDLSETEQSI